MGEFIMKKIKQTRRRLQSALLCFTLLLSLLASGGMNSRAAPVDLVITTANLADFYTELAGGITSALGATEDLSVIFDLPAGDVQLPDPGLSAPLPTVTGNDLTITFTARNGPVALLPHPDTRHLSFDIGTGRLLALGFTDVTLNGKGQLSADLSSLLPNGGGIAATGSGGILEIENAVIEHCVLESMGNGGGLFSEGSVTIRDSAFQGNGGSFGCNGGGLYARGNVRIENSRFESNQNRWTNTGGAYAAGNMTVSGSSFLRNFGQMWGGGICAGGSITVENDSLFAYNESSYGGGIYGRGSITVSDSRFEYNRADGGIYNNASGGAIYAGTDYAIVTLNGSSFTGNEATGPFPARGGAVGWSASFAGNAAITNCVFSGNVADEGHWITAAEEVSLPYSTWTGNTASAPFSHIANSYDVSFFLSRGTPLYSLVFYRNDGIDGRYYSNLPLAGLSSLLGLFPADPTRAGYQFLSWNTAKDGSGNTITDATPVADVSIGKNFKLYAQWEETFTVDFDTGGGSAVTSQTVARNGTVTRPADPTRSNYRFTGWFSDAGQSIPYNFSDPVTGNLILYAGWKASGGTSPGSSYTISFNTAGGSQVAAQTVNRNTVITKPADPAREGYTFSGWYTEKSCVHLYDFSLRVTGEFTLYAGWKWANPFTDVKTGSWYYGDVEFVHVNGLFEGMTATTFAPGKAMDRGMLVTVLGRMSGETIPTEGFNLPFSDVDKDSYYAPYVAWAAEKDIIKGYDSKTFGPGRELTREQIAEILYRYAVYTGKGPGEDWAVELKYADAGSISSWALDGAMFSQINGIVLGKPGGLFDPQGPAARAQVAAVLHRFSLNVK